MISDMISTDGLSKSFDEVTAVDRLTLEIAPGEVFGFLGPNGAGKTTTVRMLTCLIAPTVGTAVVAGCRVGEDDQAIRRQVGLLTETPGHYARLSAWQNLLIYARLYEVENPQRQVEKYLQLLDLWERRQDPAGTFSKGMRQKLAIARALLHEPRVLFLDEPTAGLDPQAARLIRQFIAKLKDEGRTIFLCTHNLDEADRLCDRVAVFKQRLRVLDTPSALRQQVYGRRILIQVANGSRDWTAVIAPIQSLHDIKQEDSRLTFTSPQPEQDNPEAIRLLVEAGAQVQFASEETHTLEDVYLALIQDSDEEAQLAA